MIVENTLLEELPEELRQFIEQTQQAKQERIEALGKTVAGIRDKAIKAREASGIEQEWLEDIEFYEGIDDGNRAESRSIKPNHPTGVVSTSQKNTSNRSTVFVNITQPYVDAAFASVSEMGNPTDDRNFELKPTPVPEVSDGSGQQAQIIAEQKAAAAQLRIDDWLVDCQWHSEMRKVVFDAAQIGTGVMKGPIPAIAKVRVVETDPVTGAVSMTIREEIKPISKRIEAQNFFPDVNCGDDIHSGAHVLERDFINVRQLREMKGLPGYQSDLIDKVLKEGANKAKSSETNMRAKEGVAAEDDRFEVWYFYGMLEAEDLKAMGCTDEEINGMESCPAVVTLVNETAIKADLNPLSSGEFPYDVIRWKKRTGSPFGIGIGRVIRTPQRIVIAATRNLMDNAGLSGGVQIGIKRDSIKPMDGNWSLTPTKIWELNASETQSISDCLSFTQIPSLQAELLKIVEFGQKMAEDVSGLPMLLQGQGGAAPDTVGGMQLLNKNASATRRMVARQIDDDLTEPHIRRYYEYILMYGDKSEQGDFTIDARGSSALVERDIQNQFSMQMLQDSLNPAFGLDPELAMEEALKAGSLDPKRFKLSEEKKAALQSQPPAPLPQVQVAQIRAETDRAIAESRAQSDMHRVKVDTDRDAIYVQAQTERDRNEANYQMQKLAIERELALLKYANDRNITLDKAQAALSTKTLELSVQRELAHAANQVQLQTGKHGHEPQVATAGTEPPGRAPNGQGYEQ